MKLKSYILGASVLLLGILAPGTKAEAQYCTTGLYGGSTYGCTDGDYIDGFVTTGGSTNISNTGTGCTNPSVMDAYTHVTGQSLTAMQGEIINFTLTSGDYSSDNYAIWADWNQDGDFDDADELIYTTSSTVSFQSFTGTFMISPSALPGTTRLRVRCVYNDPPTPCGIFDYGEIEDYDVVVVAAPACTGQPAAATASGPSAVCAGNPFTLLASGMTVGAGISYDWEYYDNGSGTWTSTGSTSPIYQVTAGITTATDYRFVTTCATGGGQDFSNVLSISINPFYFCYCAPPLVVLNSDYADNFLEGVSITGTALNNVTTMAGTASYSQYSPTVSTNTALLIPGLNYTLNIDKMWSGDEAAAWIDFDGDGSFSTTEYISISGNSASFTVPLSATAGLTGLRVRVNDWGISYSGSEACDDQPFSETEDYAVEIATLTPCSGQPDPVTASAPATVCANAPLTLSATGMTIGSGITYDWQYFDNGTGTWVSTGGSTPTYTWSVGISTTTDFRFVTTCASGGGQDISNTVTVNMNPFYVCYCSPLTGTTLNSGYADNFLENVSITGTTLNNNTTVVGSNSYTQYDPSIASNTAFLIPGFSYTLNVGLTYSSDEAGAWIDFDGDGSFSSTEYIPVVSGIATFTVPTTAAAGMTGLRVRVNDWVTPFTSTMACDDQDYSETEDYIIEIATMTACSGQPDPVTASAPATVCANVPFVLTATGMSYGTGITYDWQYFDSGTGSWVSTGGTGPTYTMPAGITTATDFRFVTLCSTGGGQDISNTISVGINPFYLCYSSPLTGTTLNSGYADNFLTLVSVPGTTLNNPTTTAGAGGYTQYSLSVASNTATLIPGLSYTLQIGKQYSGDAAAAWIDFDADGSFSSMEYIPLSGTSAMFTVPVTASPGYIGLRVRVNDWIFPYSGSEATDDQPYSETEDYVLEIAALSPCTGQPDPVTATAPANVCANIPFVLDATGMTIGAGISYDWQYYDNATSTWVSSGGNTPTYIVSAGITAATDYRLVTVCSNSGLSDTSNTVSLTINAPATCYCIPVGTSGGYGIQSFSTTGAITDISNLNSGTAAGGYGDFTSMTLTVTPSTTINFSTSFVSGTNGFAVFVDWDQDGSFAQAGDLVYHTNTYQGSPLTGTFDVPLTAPMGNTRMRIISNWYNSDPSFEYCSAVDFDYAEWEDYSVSVTAPPTCVPPTPLNVTNITATSADVSWTAVGNAVGYEWAVDNTSTLAPNAATTVNTVTAAGTVPVSSLNSGMNYYLHVRANCGGGDYSAWAVYSFVTSLVNDDYCGAIDLVVDDPAISFVNTTAATTSAADPQDFNSCTSANNNVWYKFTTGAAGIYYVNSYAPPTGSNNMSAWMWLYTVSGTCPGTLAFTLVQDMTNCSVAVPAASPVPAGSVSSIPTLSLAAGTTYYLFVDGNSGSFGDIGFNVTSNPLDVKLTSITATNAGSRNRVDWITASEDRGDYFEVERSVNGSNFTKIGSVNGKGTGASYSFWDNTPVNGVNYYRLKMMEQSGSYQYSNTVKATVKDVNAFSVEAFPNPVTENSVTVKVYGTSGANATVSLSDLTGKVIKVVSVNANTVTIDMRGLAAGVYLIKYADDAHSQTIKINKN